MFLFTKFCARITCGSHRCVLQSIRSVSVCCDVSDCMTDHGIPHSQHHFSQAYLHSLLLHTPQKHSCISGAGFSRILPVDFPAMKCIDSIWQLVPSLWKIGICGTKQVHLFQFPIIYLRILLDSDKNIPCLSIESIQICLSSPET